MLPALIMHCIRSSASRYGVAPTAIERRINEHHGGIGVTGINPGWMVYFKDFHVTKRQLENNACLNIKIGAWVLSEKQRAEQAGQTPGATQANKVEIGHSGETSGGQRLKGLDKAQTCAVYASHYYGVPTLLTLSIMRTEGGRPGTVSPNTNGSYDMGVMQVNSIWLPKLAAMGITKHEIIYNACQNVMVGTWILAGYMKHYIGTAGLTNAWEDPGAFWRAVGDYNSHTPVYNHRYQKRVSGFYQQISNKIGR